MTPTKRVSSSMTRRHVQTVAPSIIVVAGPGRQSRSRPIPSVNDAKPATASTTNIQRAGLGYRAILWSHTGMSYYIFCSILRLSRRRNTLFTGSWKSRRKTGSF